MKKLERGFPSEEPDYGYSTCELTDCSSSNKRERKKGQFFRHFPQILFGTPYQAHPATMANLLNHRIPSILSPSSRFSKQPISTSAPSNLSFCPQDRISQRSAAVRCMAHPRRVKMVAKQIQRELSDMLLTDKNLQYAILPEAALGADSYLSSLTTISDVEVSRDLQVVKVYVSIFGDDRGREVALSGLKAKAKYVRSQLGRRMKLRLTPEVRFIEDESLERGSRVIAILDKIKRDNEKKAAASPEDSKDLSDLPSDDEDWEEDDDDDETNEDIIYVN